MKTRNYIVVDEKTWVNETHGRTIFEFGEIALYQKEGDCL